MTRTVHSHCRAFQLALEVLGRPWNALILNVLQAGPLRYSQLSEAAQGPGDKVLSARLKELETHGLVDRRVASGPPVRVTYELTERGRGFGDVAVRHRALGPLPGQRRQAAPQDEQGLERGGLRPAGTVAFQRNGQTSSIVWARRASRTLTS